jgi:hypothetical protein
MQSIKRRIVPVCIYPSLSVPVPNSYSQLVLLDFFLDSHWSHLPPCWKEALVHTSPQDLANFLHPDLGRWSTGMRLVWSDLV